VLRCTLAPRGRRGNHTWVAAFHTRYAVVPAVSAATGTASGHLAHGRLVGPVAAVDQVQAGADELADEAPHHVGGDAPPSSWTAAAISVTSSSG
jgi:hypothetical protein